MSRVRDLADNNIVFVDGITTADITEGSNLFFTNTRADARVDLKMIDEDNMSSNSAAHMPSQQSVKAYVDTEVAGLVSSAPGTLDTLNELAAALGDDANFSTTITNSIATKLPLAGGTMTGVIAGFESTGIDDNATDTVITVQQNGMVGIGIDGPGARLTLSGTAGAADNSSVMLIALGATQKTYFGTANATGNIITGSSSGDTVLRSNGHNILFSVDSGSSSAVYIKSDGKVGIGTTNPGDKLEVSRTSTDQTVGLTLTNTQNGGYGSGIVWKAKRSDNSSVLTAAEIVVAGEDSWNSDGSTSSQMQFWTQKGNTLTKHMTLTKNGNLGIGTTSPDRALTIEGSDFSSSSIRLKRTGGGSSNDAGLQFESAAGANADTGMGGIWFQNSLDGNAYALIRARTDDSTGTSGRLDFMTSTSLVNNSSSPSLTIKSSGNVGIGTTSPQQILHIHNSSGNFSAEAVLTGRLSTGTPKAEVAFKRGTSGDGAMLVLRSSNSSGALIDAVTIKDGTGNVGIGGDTYDAQFKLHVNKGSSNYNPTTGITENIFGLQTSYDAPGSQLLTFSKLDGNWVDGTTGADSAFGWLWNYQTNTRAGIVYDHRSTEKFQLFSSYGAITFTTADGAVGSGVPTDSNMNERMTILPGGNVGIGTTAPSRVFHLNSGTTNTGARFESTDQTASIEFADNSGTAEIGATGSDLVFFPGGYEKARVFATGGMKIGDQMFREGYAGINGSQTRWYKIVNYANTGMISGRIFMSSNRFGGYNQTGAYREYKLSIGGYSNNIYGPSNTTGDSGEGGYGSLHIGSDNHVYLQVSASIYGGSLWFYILGYINNWQFDNTVYVTSQP